MPNPYQSPPPNSTQKPTGFRPNVVDLFAWSYPIVFQVTLLVTNLAFEASAMSISAMHFDDYFQSAGVAIQLLYIASLLMLVGCPVVVLLSLLGHVVSRRNHGRDLMLSIGVSTAIWVLVSYSLMLAQVPVIEFLAD